MQLQGKRSAQTKNDIREFYKDRRGWLWNIGSAILPVVFTPLVLFGFGLVEMNSGFWMAILAGVVAGAIVFLLWFIGVVVYYFIKAPERIYDRQQAALATWEKKYGGEKIRADKICFQLDGEPSFACLWVENHEPHDLRDCRATLEQVYARAGNTWKPVRVKVNSELLTWPTLENKEKVVPGDGGRVRINIATCQIGQIYNDEYYSSDAPHRIYFTLEDGNRPILNDIGSDVSNVNFEEVYVIVTLVGKIGSKSIDALRFTGGILIRGCILTPRQMFEQVI